MNGAWGSWSSWTPSLPSASTICRGRTQTTDQTRRRSRPRTRTRTRTLIRGNPAIHTNTTDTDRDTENATENRTRRVTGTRNCSNYPAPSVSIVVSDLGRGRVEVEVNWIDRGPGTRPDGTTARSLQACGSITGYTTIFPADTCAAPGDTTASLSTIVNVPPRTTVSYTFRARMRYDDGSTSGAFSSYASASDSITTRGGGRPGDEDEELD